MKFRYVFLLCTLAVVFTFVGAIVLAEYYDFLKDPITKFIGKRTGYVLLSTPLLVFVWAFYTNKKKDKARNVLGGKKEMTRGQELMCQSHVD